MITLKPNKYGLALHTTTPQLGIAISNFATDSRYKICDFGHDLSSHLHQNLQEILQPQTWQALAFVAVAKGPGGFTGTRIGVVTGRTLAQQLNIPLFGISNLAALACFHHKQSAPANLLAVQMKARRGYLFVAIYQLSTQNNNWEIYLEDTIMTQEKWQETLNNLDYPYQLIEASDSIADTVTSVLALGYQEWQQGKQTQWSEILPFYGQDPV